MTATRTAVGVLGVLGGLGVLGVLGVLGAVHVLDTGGRRVMGRGPRRERVGQHGAMRTKILVLVALVTVGTVALPPAAQARARSSSPTYYVSLGDSYSVGYQPGLGSTPGYTAYVAARTHMTLVSFGCAGATTTSILDSVGCPAIFRDTPGGVTYPTLTQAAAAEAFITAHRGHIGLITVTIGVNDVTGCMRLATGSVTCASGVVKNTAGNVTTLTSDLRRDAGPKVPIIGLTYPDMFLGGYVYPTVPPTTAQVDQATTSVPIFKHLLNPVLAKAYASSAAVLVDVTAATGAYTPFGRTVKTKAYGTIPVAVARVCTFTWFCGLGDVHPTTAGYTLMGRLVVARYRAMRKR
ncbi:MAG TPA: SGNH/GDSL hydrolase family protein [Acidimicrobiales bacterium]|nr:SGNH/GDSL hydrolase family protein [Acidimicrobiales bacterium]